MNQVTALVVTFVAFIYFLHAASASFIECIDTADCDTHQCCMLGGSRYSRPRCIDLGSVGQPCRPYNSVPFNTTVSYPNGLSVDLTNVYFILCNCAQDLVCDRNEGTCRAPQIMTDNDLQ